MHWFKSGKNVLHCYGHIYLHTCRLSCVLLWPPLSLQCLLVGVSHFIGSVLWKNKMECYCFFHLICWRTLLISFLWTITLPLSSWEMVTASSCTGNLPQPWASITMTPLKLFFFFFKILFIYSWEIQREKQRHRHREKKAPGREPNVDLDPGPQDPKIMPWTKGRHSTTSHPGVPPLNLLSKEDHCTFIFSTQLGSCCSLKKIFFLFKCSWHTMLHSFQVPCSDSASLYVMLSFPQV